MRDLSTNSNKRYHGRIICGRSFRLKLYLLILLSFLSLDNLLTNSKGLINTLCAISLIQSKLQLYMKQSIASIITFDSCRGLEYRILHYRDLGSDSRILYCWILTLQKISQWRANSLWWPIQWWVIVAKENLRGMMYILCSEWSFNYMEWTVHWFRGNLRVPEEHPNQEQWPRISWEELSWVVWAFHWIILIG